MPEEKSELDKFFEGVKQDTPELNLDPEPKVEEKEEEQAERPNRQQRRSQENASIRRQLEEERIARAAAEARAQAIAEMKTSGDVDMGLHQALFGSAEPTPETRSVVQNMKGVLETNRKAAADDAYSRFQQEREDAQQEEVDAEREIDDNLSALEEEYDVDLTSNSPAGKKARTEFLSMVEKLSPKDSDGNILEYADFGSTYEMYQNSKKRDNSQKKELAARSMATSSGEANTQQQEQTAWERGRQQLRALGLNV